MAYSLQTYNVFDSAGITADDDRAAQVTKIAAWINANFSDIVTAETVDDLKVRVIDNKVRAGFGWGGNSATTYYKYACVSRDASTYNEYANTAAAFPIETLGLFVCCSGKNFVMDFINTQGTVEPTIIPHFMHIVGKNGDTEKAVCIVNLFGSGGDTSYTNSWSVISENMIVPSYNNIVSNYQFAGTSNYNLNKTILTVFVPPYENLIATDLYRIQGTTPTNKTIFELNGTKYLALKYWNSGNKNEYEYANFALKLG